MIFVFFKWSFPFGICSLLLVASHCCFSLLIVTIFSACSSFPCLCYFQQRTVLLLLLLRKQQYYLSAEVFGMNVITNYTLRWARCFSHCSPRNLLSLSWCSVVSSCGLFTLFLTSLARASTHCWQTWSYARQPDAAASKQHLDIA